MTADSIVRRSPDQVSCELDGETAILNLNTGIYYSLDDVGTRIWEFLQESRSVADIREAITAEFDVGAGRCEQEIVEFLAEMSAEGLIRTDASFPS